MEASFIYVYVAYGSARQTASPGPISRYSIYLKLQQPLDDVTEKLPNDFVVRPLLSERYECDTRLGHRDFPYVNVTLQK